MRGSDRLFDIIQRLRTAELAADLEGTPRRGDSMTRLTASGWRSGFSTSSMR
jgi:hypothetical protein